MEKVRLTVQVRDHQNHVRVTVHEDVAINDVAARCVEISTRAATFYRSQRRKAKDDSST